MVRFARKENARTKAILFVQEKVTKTIRQPPLYY